ncbi:mCG1042142, isoform CRA_c, partial [Mus musculus]
KGINILYQLYHTRWPRDSGKMAGQTPLDLPTWSLDIYLASLSSLGPDAGCRRMATGSCSQQVRGAVATEGRGIVLTRLMVMMTSNVHGAALSARH